VAAARLIALLWALVWAPGLAAQTVPSLPALPVVTITQAVLTGLQGERAVALPHVLQPTDFAATGGRVQYRLAVDLAAVPKERLAILVRKLSLSGEVSLNGQWAGACGPGPLEVLICHYRSFIVEPAPLLWHPGRNTLDITVYAIPYLMNGLAPVEVGPADRLQADGMRWRPFWQVEVVRGLTALSALLGTISLAIGLILRRDSIYLWFGCVALTYAASNINVLVVRRDIPLQLFSWIILSSRLVSIFLLLPSMLMLFHGVSRRALRLCVGYLLAAVLAIWYSANHNLVVMALYAPLLVIAPAAWWQMLRGAWRSRQPTQLACAAAGALLLAISVHDWLRMGGQTPYEGVYVITYAYGLVLVLFGSLLIGLLASSLQHSRTLSVAAHQRLLALQTEKTRLEERERILQDLHDGFGSQLASARYAAEHRALTQPQLRELLAECMADLYLVIDTLGNRDDSLADAFADLRFRTSQRLVAPGPVVDWALQLQAVPPLPKSSILQLLRIAQEAIHNALRHGPAAHVWVRAEFDRVAGAVTLQIQDDGGGMGPASAAAKATGAGLAGLRQRAANLGAALAIDSSPAGTTVRLHAPVAALKSSPMRAPG
jgi:signal transduction histidine kinase